MEDVIWQRTHSDETSLNRYYSADERSPLKAHYAPKRDYEHFSLHK